MCAMADTLKPCRCKSRITTSSPSLTTTASPEPLEGWWPIAGRCPATLGSEERRHAKVGNFQPPDLGRIRAPLTRLRAQIIATVRQPPTGQLKPRVSAQMVEIVGVLVATGDSKDPGAQNVIDAVRHQQRVARVRDQPRQRLRYPQLPLHNAEQHDTTVGRDASTVEGCNDLLAFNGWKIERQKAIVRHGGCGSVRARGQNGFDTQSLSTISTLRDTRQRI